MIDILHESKTRVVFFRPPGSHVELRCRMSCGAAGWHASYSLSYMGFEVIQSGDLYVVNEPTDDQVRDHWAKLLRRLHGDATLAVAVLDEVTTTAVGA